MKAYYLNVAAAAFFAAVLLTQTASAESWTSVKELVGNAQKLHQSGNNAGAASLLIQAMTIRRQLPVLPPFAGDGKESLKPDAETDKDLNIEVILVANALKISNRYANALALFKWQASDPAHNSVLMQIVAQCSMAECYTLMNNDAEAARDRAAAFGTLDAAKARISKHDYDMAVNRLSMYKNFLMVHRKQAQCDAVSARLANYTQNMHK